MVTRIDPSVPMKKPETTMYLQVELAQMQIMLKDTWVWDMILGLERAFPIHISFMDALMKKAYKVEKENAKMT
jgi:hypothetical protein